MILDSLQLSASICPLTLMGCFFLIGLPGGAGRNTLRTLKPFNHTHTHTSFYYLCEDFHRHRALLCSLPCP